jgi:hypothetical protein
MAIIEREGDGYVALCPEFDIASQGDTLEGPRANLIEALTCPSKLPTLPRLGSGSLGRVCSSG